MKSLNFKWGLWLLAMVIGLLLAILCGSAQGQATNLWTNSTPPVSPPGWTNTTAPPPAWYESVQFYGDVTGTRSNTALNTGTVSWAELTPEIRSAVSNSTVTGLSSTSTVGGDVSGVFTNIQLNSNTISDVEIGTNLIDPSKILGGVITSNAMTNAAYNATRLQNRPVSTNTPAAGYIIVDSGSTWTPRALSGDATLGSTGALTIADGAVTWGKLDSNTVDAVLVRQAELTGVQTALQASIDTKINSNDASSVHGLMIRGGAISNVHLAVGAVAASNVAGGAIGNQHLGANAVAGSNIVGGAIGNQHLAPNAVAGTNVADGSLGTNDADLVQWDGRYLNAKAQDTMSAGVSGGFVLSISNTAVPGSGLDVHTTNASGGAILRLRNGNSNIFLVDEKSFDFMNRPASNLASLSVLGSLAALSLAGDGASVTNVNAQTLDGIDSTGLTTVARFELLNEAAIVDTNARSQRVLGDLHGASFIADQGVVAACTNCATSTNMLVNGDFSQGGAYWTFTGGANSNSGSGGQLIVAGNTSGTAIQSNQFSATPGSWQITYTNTATDATGSITVAFGGVERTQVGALTGFVSYIVGPRAGATNGFSISASVTGSTAGAWKNFTLKQVFSGDVTAVYGSFTHLAASSVVANAQIRMLKNSFSNETGTAIGGVDNVPAGAFSTIGGGATNRVGAVAGLYATIGGGRNNSATFSDAAVGGGHSNRAHAAGATIGGGDENFIDANSVYATIAGGEENTVGSEASHAFIAGGHGNTAASNAFAAGAQANASTAGSWVWNAPYFNGFVTFRSNYTDHGSATFNIRANGGVWISETYVFDGSGRLIVNVATNPGAADGAALVKRGTNLSFEILTASVTGVFDSAVTVTHSATNYPTHTNLLGTLAGIDSRLGSKMGTSNSTVTTAQLQDSSVTSQKMAAAVWNQIASMSGSGGTTNASGIGIALTPTNYTPASVNLEGHAIGIDQALGSISAGGTGKLYAVAGIYTPEVTFEAGSNMSISTNGTKITFASTGGSGGGATNYQYISSYTVPTLGVSLVELQAIPQTFKDLVVVMHARGTGSGAGGWKANNNGDSVYDYIRDVNEAGTKTEDFTDNQTSGQMLINNSASGTSNFTVARFYVHNYTNYHRQLYVTMSYQRDRDTGRGGGDFFYFRDALGTALTSLTFNVDTSVTTNWAVGSEFYLYGVRP